MPGDGRPRPIAQVSSANGDSFSSSRRFVHSGRKMSMCRSAALKLLTALSDPGQSLNDGEPHVFIVKSLGRRHPDPVHRGTNANVKVLANMFILFI